MRRPPKAYLVCRPGRNFEIRWRIEGVTVSQTTGTADPGQARDALIRQQTELDIGLTMRIRPLQLTELLQHWLADRPRTGPPGAYEADMTALVERLAETVGRAGKLRTDQLSPAVIDRYVRRRLEQPTRQRGPSGKVYSKRRPPSVSRIKTELRHLRALCNYALDLRPPAMVDNPVNRARACRLRPMPRQHHAITEAEFRALLARAPDLATYALLLTAWFTGARKSHILGLHYYDVDVVARTVRVTHTKTAHISLVPLPEPLAAAIDGLYEGQPEAGRIWPADPLAGKRFARLCDVAGIQHHRFQDFRLTCSSRLRVYGIADQTAAGMLGHSPPIALKHYTDLTPHADRIAAALQLADLPAAPPNPPKRT